MSDRLPLLNPAQLDEAQRKLYDGLTAEEVPWAQKSGFQAATPDGRLLGPFNALLFNPAVGTAYIDLFHADKNTTSLPKRVHEIVILTTGAAWNSAYELYAHTAVGQAAGLPDDIIQAIAAGQTPALSSEPEAAAYEFTRQLTRAHTVNADTYARASNAFGDRGLVDMTLLIGLYLMTCAALNAFQVPVPEAA